jgi:hypothetical protein
MFLKSKEMGNSTNRIEEVLDRCILDVQSGRKSIDECLSAHPDIRFELEPLLRLIVALQEVPKITATESFKAAAPTRMQNLIKSRSAGVDQDQAKEPFYKRHYEAFLGIITKGKLQTGGRRLSVIASFVLVVLTIALLTNGVVAASANALPGEAFYSTKIALERIELSFSQTDFEDSFLYLKYASRRINEASRLVMDNRVDNIDIVLEDYVRQIFGTMAILLESESLSDQERAELASILVHDMTQYEDQIRDLLAHTPENYKGYIEEILNLSQYEQSIVMEAMIRAPWGSGSDPGVAVEIVAATQATAPAHRATKTPVPPDATPTPTATNTVFPIPYGTPIPWWWFDPSILPTDIDWLSIWPTVVDQIPPQYLTELPPEFQPPFDIPTWIPVPPAWLQPESTPHPPIPPFPPHP